MWREHASMIRFKLKIAAEPRNNNSWNRIPNYFCALQNLTFGRRSVDYGYRIIAGIILDSHRHADNKRLKQQVHQGLALGHPLPVIVHHVGDFVSQQRRQLVIRQPRSIIPLVTKIKPPGSANAFGSSILTIRKE